MISILPMYDIPQLRLQTDAFWEALASLLGELGLKNVPEHLCRTQDLNAAWLDPSLFLGQTCGYPFVTYLNGRVTLVAVPAYAAQGCEGAYYRSAIMVRRDMKIQNLSDLKDKICAINSYDSNSGMNLLRSMVAPIAAGERFFKDVLVTGSHRASLSAIASGYADVAAIDCVTLALLSRYESESLNLLSRLCWTPATLGLPFVTSTRTSPADISKIQDGLKIISEDSKYRHLRESLLLDHFEFPEAQDYDQVMSLEYAAIGAGYKTLA